MAISHLSKFVKNSRNGGLKEFTRTQHESILYSWASLWSWSVSSGWVGWKSNLKYKKTRSTGRLKFPLYLEHVRRMDIAVSHLSKGFFTASLRIRLRWRHCAAFLSIMWRYITTWPCVKGEDVNYWEHSIHHVKKLQVFITCNGR